MNLLKNLSLAVMATIAVTAGVTATAAATTVEVGGAAKNSSVEVTMTLKSGTSLIVKDEFGTTADTCSGATIKGSTSGTFTGTTVSGKIGTLIFASCTHTTHVIANGSFSGTWTSGTNGVISLSGSEVTIVSTFFGASATCKAGAGSALGTLTGVSSGNATLDVNTHINCGILGNASWTGTYSVTSPGGFGFVG